MFPTSGQEVSYPFIGKPDRNLYRDYYEIIQHPVSLRSIQKRVRGTDSRKNTSRTTAYPTWQSFEEEVSYIWRNARDYNEDDSEISILAGILEVGSYPDPLAVSSGLLTLEPRTTSIDGLRKPRRLFPNPSRKMEPLRCLASN
jgi:hypothetical protein